MNTGKLNWNDLKDIIDITKNIQREDIRVKSGIGEDCSVINFGDYECVVSTDPITGAGKNSGRLAVHINCNDAAACGIEPLGILVTILAPENVEFNDIKNVMKEISEECEKLNVQILGGHTEITTAVNKMIISCTIIGKGKAGSAISTSGARLNDDIIVTKYLGMEGTTIVINDYTDKVKEILSKEDIIEGRSYLNNISVVKEGLICGEFGVHSMHDITEGGVLGALWELANASNKGFKVFEDKMPISEVTKRLCNYIGVDPLRLISSGSMLITTDRGEELIKVLNLKGIKATIIGKITNDNGILIQKQNKIEVTPPKRDELFVFMEKLKNNNI